MSPFVVAIYFLVITLALFLAYRMTSLALRTRQLPEACIAGFAFGTAVGTFLLTIGRGIGALPEGWDVPVHAAGALLISIAAALLGLFTWRVFRPDAPWARRGFVALGALVLASLVASLATPEDFRSHVRTPGARRASSGCSRGASSSSGPAARRCTTGTRCAAVSPSGLPTPSS